MLLISVDPMCFQDEDAGAADDANEVDGSLIECPDQSKYDTDPANWRSQVGVDMCR